MKRLILLITLLIAGSGCTVKYSFSGASIASDIKTITVERFDNMATMVSAKLTNDFNDGLTQKIQRETRLQLVREGGDVVFEGHITNYDSAPLPTVSAELQQVMQNRLTVTVWVKYTNVKYPKNNYEKSFSTYADYPSSTMLTSAEGGLIPEIVDKLIQDIFNEAFSNW